MKQWIWITEYQRTILQPYFSLARGLHALTKKNKSSWLASDFEGKWCPGASLITTENFPDRFQFLPLADNQNSHLDSYAICGMKFVAVTCLNSNVIFWLGGLWSMRKRPFQGIFRLTFEQANINIASTGYPAAWPIRDRCADVSEQGDLGL